MGSHKVISLLVLLAAVFWVSLPLSAQTRPRHQGPPQVAQPEPAAGQDEPLPKEMTDRMAKEQLKNRYDSLKRDSEKLLELATELKQYVDKSGEGTMSLDVIRKCEEIEKLSKSVRAKMKGN